MFELMYQVHLYFEMFGMLEWSAFLSTFFRAHPFSAQYRASKKENHGITYKYNKQERTPGTYCLLCINRYFIFNISLYIIGVYIEYIKIQT